MASLIQLSDSNAMVYISSSFFGQLQTIRDIGGNRNSSNTITLSKVRGTFSDGTNVQTIDTPYATITVNPSTGRIAHAFPFTYNGTASATAITDTGSMNIYGTSQIFDNIVVSTISSGGYFDANAILVGSIPPVVFSNTTSTIQNLGQYYTSSVLIQVQKLQSNSYIFNTDLFSTVENLPYFSSPSLQSTINGLATFRYISQSQLTSTIIGINSNYINSSNLLSTVNGLGTAGYVSSADFLSTFDEYQAGFIHGPVYTSTVAGLGTSGYVSSASLLSTVQGLGTFGYISTSWLVSTTTSLESYIEKSAASSLYLSTADGLGHIYMSTQNITSTYTGLITSNASILASTVAGLGTSGYISTPQLTSTIMNLGSLTYISTPELTLAVDGTFLASYSNSFASTSVSLGSNPFSFISTPHMVSTVTAIISLQSNTLISTVAGLGQQYVSTSGFVSTVQGLGSAPYSYLSSAYLTVNVSPFLALPYSEAQLISTVQGLGTLGYVSGRALAPIFQNIGGTYIAGSYLATNVPNLPYMKQANLTTDTANQIISYSNTRSSILVSTFQNLGSFGYTSTTINPGVVLASTTIGITNLLSASYPAPTTATQTIGGSDSNIFKWVNGVTEASALITVSATDVNTRNIYTTCNVTAYRFHGDTYYADGSQLATSSDRRVKTDIVAMSNALEKINALTGIYFTRKDDPMHTRNVGFLAQDIEQVFPNLVITDDTEAKMKSVKYESIHVAILEAIKELDAELDSLIH